MPDSVPEVRHPAQMMAFSSIEAFQAYANNFYLMFLRMEGAVSDIFRHGPAFHRFIRRYPHLVAELEEVLEAEGRRPGVRSWPLLWEAYRLMSELVDIADPGVVRRPHPQYLEIDPGTGVDVLYLTR
jgi:hypothetical protein